MLCTFLTYIRVNMPLAIYRSVDCKPHYVTRVSQALSNLRDQHSELPESSPIHIMEH